jgi:putative transposon-encoded protein
MFDSNSYSRSNSNSSASIHVNACSGGIYKTYIESWFEKFSLNSGRANQLFNNNKGNDMKKTYEHRVDMFGHSQMVDKVEYVGDKTIVLQMVICGDQEVMVELIDKKDFDKYFETKGGEDV